MLFPKIVQKCREFFQDIFSGSRRAIEDVIVSMVPQAASVVVGFVTSVLVARGLGPKGMGSYALILSVSGMAVALSDLGVGQTAIRYASRAAAANEVENQFAVLRWAFRLRMLLVCLASATAFAAAPFVAERLWHEPNLSPLVRISLLTGIFSAIAAIPTIYFQSIKRFRMNATVTVGQTLVSFFGIVLLAWLNAWSLERIIAVSVVAAGVGAAVFTVLVPKASFLALSEFRHRLSKLPKLLLRAPAVNATSHSMDSTGADSFALFMVLSSVIVTITMRADMWLMGFYLQKSEIGLYSVASRFTLPLVIVLGALNTALWPRASALTDLKTTVDMIRKTLKLSLVVAVLAALYSLLAPLMTPYIFGRTYSGGVLLAQLLCIRYSLSLLVCPVGVIGYSFGLVRVYWWINLLQLVAVVGINLLLLPHVGAMGAAWALIINEIIGFTFAGLIIGRRFLEMKAGLSGAVKQ